MPGISRHGAVVDDLVGFHWSSAGVPCWCLEGEANGDDGPSVRAGSRILSGAYVHGEKGSPPLIHGRHSHARLPDVSVSGGGPWRDIVAPGPTAFTQTDVHETLAGHWAVRFRASRQLQVYSRW